MPHTVLSLVNEAIRERGLLSEGQRVLIAVSGGQDSCTLLHALAALRDTWRLSLHAAHFHHGLRGTAADDDAAFVQHLGDLWDVPVTIGRGDVAVAARRTKASVQEAARNARGAFLERTANEIGADAIALAHTADDRVETILLNLFRGSGLNGLCALPPRQGRLIRPLCDVTRAMTGAYCRSIGVVPRRDASNRQLRYTRNRIRADLLPSIEAYLNPSARAAILRMADLLAEDRSYLDAQAAEIMESLVHVSGTEEWSIAVEDLRAIHPALQARVVRKMIEGLIGSCADVHATEVAAILRAVTARKRYSCTLRCGARASVTNRLTLEPSAAAACPRVICRELPVPGCVYVHEAGVSVTASECCLTEMPAAVAAFEVYVPLASIEPPLVVRTIRVGDRIRPMGLGGSKAVMDHLRDAGLGESERRNRLIVADARGVLWLPAVALDERARITEVPCRVVRISRIAEQTGG